MNPIGLGCVSAMSQKKLSVGMGPDQGCCHVPFHGMASVTVELHIYGSDAYADNLSIVAFWPSGSIM